MFSKSTPRVIRNTPAQASFCQFSYGLIANLKMVTGRLAMGCDKSLVQNWFDSAVNSRGAVSPAMRATANITPVTAVHPENRIIDLTFDVQKGQQVTIERIELVGNTKTRDKVIRRELRVFEGELFSGTGMRKSKERVTALGFFETVEVSHKPGSDNTHVVVQVEVDRSKGKNRLFFTISEAHGFYVEQFRVRFWYVKEGVTGPEDSPVNVTQFFDRFLPAKDTLRVCMEVVPAELTRVNGDMGDTSNWKAEIVWHGRARAKNPDPMPPRTDIVTSCD